MKGCLFQTNNGATAFLETRNGSITEIHGCTTPNGDMIDETNTIATSCYASIDYLRHLSNNTVAEERLLVRSGSTPRVHLSEIGAADDLVIEVAGAVGYLRGIDSTTFSTERTFLSVGLASTSIGFLGAAPVTRPTVTGSRGGIAALADLLTELETLGLITDSSS